MTGGSASPPRPEAAAFSPWLHNGLLLGALLLAGASMSELLLSVWVERVLMAASLRLSIRRAGVGALRTTVTNGTGQPLRRRLDRMANELLAATLALGVVLAAVLLGAVLSADDPLPQWQWQGQSLLIAAMAGAAAALTDHMTRRQGAKDGPMLVQKLDDAGLSLTIDIVLLLLVPWTVFLLNAPAVLALLFVLRALAEARLARRARRRQAVT